MRKTTENQGNRQTLSEYFSPRSKVKDFPHQRCSLSQSASFLHETPMKPSQVPNRLLHPPPRRMLPLQSPGLCHRGRLGPLQHPPQPPGPVYSSGIVPSSTANISSPVKRPQPSPITSKVFQPSYPRSRKDISNYSSSSSSIKTDALAKPKVTLPITGREYEITQRQGSSKVRSSDVGNSIHALQPHRPSAPPPLTPRTGQEGRPLPFSDSESWSPGNSQWRPWRCQSSQFTQSPDRSSGPRSPTMHSPVAARQDYKGTPSGEKLIPEGLNCSSLKRHRQSEICDNTANKKLCLPDSNSGPAQTPNCTVGNSIGLSLVSPPSSNYSSDLELSPKTTYRLLRTEQASDKPVCLTLSSTPTQSSCSSLAPTPYLASQPSSGVKPAYTKITQNQIVRLKELKSPSKPVDESLKKEGEEKKKRDNASSLLSSLKQLLAGQSGVPHKDTDSSHNTPLGSHQIDDIQHNTPVLHVKSLSRDDTKGETKVGESRGSDSRTPKPAPKPNSGSLSCHVIDRNRTTRPRRPTVIPNDIDDLFTPDPLTYVISSKPAKPSIEGGEKRPLASRKSCLSRTVSSSGTPSAGSPCRETQNSTITPPPPALDTKMSPFSPLLHPEFPIPTVVLQRVKFENGLPFKDTGLKNSSLISSSGRQLSVEIVKTDERPKSSLSPKNVRPCTSEADTATSKRTSVSRCSPSTPEGSQKDEGVGKRVDEEDPLDVELDLGLSFELDLDLTQSSQSSEEDQLMSLQEMMARMAKPPDTPEKGAFSEPSTPGHPSCQSKPPVQATAKPGIYKNNLDQMLKEINSNKRSKEIETKLLNACEEDLLRIAEYEEAEENREEAITTEQQEFLQRYSLMSSAIRDLHPGEVVFNLENFGRIFNQHTLQLRQCMVNPQETAQKTLLWSSPAQLRLHVIIGLFQEAYDSPSPCPPQVTRFLFKMMSVHTERMISEQILQALRHIACAAACQIVKKGSQQFEVWVPSVADVTLVLMNMGVPFVTLFPFENLQPPFTEGDLLEDIHISSESSSSNKEQSTFPEHNCNNILKYLSYCMGLCPRAYSDYELLLLLTVVSRVGLDARLALQPNVDLCSLQYNIVNNIRDWDTMLPRICLALTDLTDDHHNMCWLVQLLPDNARGKQLRRHLGLSMISKLLDGNCTYRPTGKEFQLSELRPYLPRMQPSTLLRGIVSSSSRKQKEKEEDLATLDQQTYYLCYSLLTLANEASNFQFFPAHQKEQLLFLCSELETHIKCDIRESEKCLYRSKVKDLVARIYTKWQMLLQRTRPLHGKLYDYWKPLHEDTLNSSQREEETEISDDGDETVLEEDSTEATMEEEEDEEEEEIKAIEENDVAMDGEEEMEGEEQEEACITLRNEGVTTDTLTEKDQEEWEEADEGMKQTEKLTEKEGDNTTGETDEKTEESVEPMLEELNLEMPEVEPLGCWESKAIDVQTEERDLEYTGVETESPRKTSCLSQAAVCDSVS
ncbi:SMC5-SMC6 complex localization factor protein 2 isoform X2 [Centroberyx affinis]|uniref:SMC5-SMC6 complex localization factor protein 2 isoform X2 n=1 Tax=Centroberyx affinis TaxID=166261 RepID=UPI003A5BE34D